MVGLANLFLDAYIFNNLALVAVVAFHSQYILRAVRNTAPQRNISRVPAHNLNDTASLMGGRCIPHLVDRLHRGINRRIKSNRVLRAGDIKIDCARHADCVDPPGCKLPCTLERTITADHNKTINAVFAADIRPLILAVRRHKFRAARRVENRAAALDNISHAARVHVHYIFLE